jgi:hypothetical protein
VSAWTLQIWTASLVSIKIDFTWLAVLWFARMQVCPFARLPTYPRRRGSNQRDIPLRLVTEAARLHSGKRANGQTRAPLGLVIGAVRLAGQMATEHLNGPSMAPLWLPHRIYPKAAPAAPL